MKMALQHFALLRNKDYSGYFIGQMFSMTGTFMQQVVLGWLIYRLSGSAFWLGLITFLTHFPAFVASPFAGVAADLKSRRDLLILTQVVSMAQAATLSILTLTHQIELWHIATLAAVLGVANSFELTARHAFAVEMVGKRDLASAIALNSILINSCKIIGPALGGLLIYVIGEGWCFAMNAVSYLAVILSLTKFRSIHPERRQVMIFTSLREGWTYIRRMPSLHFPLYFALLLGFIGAPYITLLPIYVKECLRSGSGTLGWLTAFHAAGALLGTFHVLDGRSISNIRSILCRRIIVFGVLLMILSLLSERSIAAMILAGCGFFFVSCYPLINAFLQQIVSDQMRGRVLSIYTMTFLGTSPLGGILAGSLASRYGTRESLFGFGVLGLLASSFLLLRDRFHR